MFNLEGATGAGMIEKQAVDLNMLSVDKSMSMPFTSADSPHWAALQTLAAHESCAFLAGYRHDIYVVFGSLIIDTQRFSVGSFVSRGSTCHITAGEEGVSFFYYRDRNPSGNESISRDELGWYAGQRAGISVAQLSLVHHSLSLVHWQPGTRTGSHSHSCGEEIFVLEGELCDELGCYSAGSWLRFYPGQRHSPYTQTTALILLRNGHLARDGQAKEM